MIERRASALLVSAVIALTSFASARADGLRVHLIGTGGPELTPERTGISTLVDANGRKFLFDVGRGALQNIYLSRIHPNDVTRIFLTHLHNDHYEGLPSLWMTPWFMFARKQRIELWDAWHRTMVEGMRACSGDLEHRSNPPSARTWTSRYEVAEA